MNNLRKNILATIAYYDVLDYPLTAFEIWKYLIMNQESTSNNQEEEIKLLDITNELDREEIKKYIEECRGFYFFQGRQDLVAKRIENNKISESKLKIIKKVAWFLRFVPFVRMVAITGRVAMKNAQKGSDLDLLIVLKHGHIFTGRTLVTLLVHLLGKRRYGKKIKNRICLNYFITTKSLEISNQDLFSSSEYYFIRPIFGFKVFRKFQTQNRWIRKYKPNYKPIEIAETCLLKDSYFSKKIRKIGEMIFSFSSLEKMLKKWQLRRIAVDLRTHQEGSMVEAGDDALIFLPEPQGPQIFERFKERLKNLEKLD